MVNSGAGHSPGCVGRAGTCALAIRQMRLVPILPVRVGCSAGRLISDQLGVSNSMIKVLGRWLKSSAFTCYMRTPWKQLAAQRSGMLSGGDSVDSTGWILNVTCHVCLYHWLGSLFIIV